MDSAQLSIILLKDTSTIKEAIVALEKSNLKIVLAVDGDDQLVGVLTDGDIRRCLIKGLALDTAISNAINKNFVSVDENVPDCDVLAMMREQDIFSIPTLRNGKVVDVIERDHVSEPTIIDNPVVLMAGGFGLRLRPLTDHCPKPLLKIGNTPIIDIIIENFIKSGFRNFYISTHYKAEMIKDFLGDGSLRGVNIQYLDETEPLGTAGSLGMLPDKTPQLPMIVMNADILTKVNFLNLLTHHNKSKSLATMCVRNYSHQVPYGVVTSDTDNKLCQITEKPDYNYFISSGIYVLDHSILNSIQPNKSLDMPSLLNSIAASRAGESVNLYPLHEYWLDIGKMHDFNKAQIDFSFKYSD